MIFLEKRKEKKGKGFKSPPRRTHCQNFNWISYFQMLGKNNILFLSFKL